MDFSSVLVEWYQQNKRNLPWRNTIDPYKIWLSKIILQQTRVDQGMNYYLKFIECYPTVIDLANAKEHDVLKLWQGLGYYSRARNLHYTAKYISYELNGKFPDDYKEILKLKGVGEYTAAAIASFSFNLPYPVVDGNVYRVLSRVFNIDTPIDSTLGKKQFKELAMELLDKKNPAEYNQAIMEFGALYCKPQSPDCINCIFNANCIGNNENKVAQLPVKNKKIKQKNRYFNYLVFTDDNSVLINQRIENDIWKGLYDFPLIETKAKVEHIQKLDLNNYSSLVANHQVISKSNEYSHILSHQKIHATFWKISVKDLIEINRTDLKVSWKEINKYPVPKLIENFFIQN